MIDKKAPDPASTAASPADTSAARGDASIPRDLRAAFLAGLGADLDVPQNLTPELMQAIGALIREVTGGTMELLRLRAEAKSALHADMTMLDARAINPLKAAWDVDVALQHLFAPQRPDIQAPLKAMTEAYDDLRAHDRDLVASIRAAMRGLLARFDPDALANRLGSESMIDSFLPANKKARRWDSFVDLYADVCVEAEQDFWSVFEKELRRAYAAQDRTLLHASKNDAA
ncbi:MAG TPA: type VI secretion system-associated FHA domain protein TagH [Casimicrobiaceae bacterium]